MRRMQLRFISRTMCDLWWTRRVRCILLQGMHNPRKRCKYSTLIRSATITFLPFSKHRETVVRKLLTWVAQKRICSTNERNTVSSSDKNRSPSLPVENENTIKMPLFKIQIKFFILKIRKINIKKRHKQRVRSSVLSGSGSHQVNARCMRAVTKPFPHLLLSWLSSLSPPLQLVPA